MLPLPASIPWRAIGIAALAVAVFGAGWMVNGWRWDARWQARELALAEAQVQAEQASRSRENALRADLAALDQQYTDERTAADAEIDRLRAAVDAGRSRLRVAATCPDRVPATAAGAGVGDGAGPERPELAPEARPDYFALRSGLDRVSRQLTACQAILRAERQ